MGQNGSDVARDAADIILMDDNFSSIVLGIEQGRVIFDNLKKTVAYTLAHLLPEIVPVLLDLALGFPAGLSSLQILSIDLCTELGPAISLAYEKAEKDIMNRPPRNPDKDKLVSTALLIYSYLIAGLLESVGAFLAYCAIFWQAGVGLGDLFMSEQTYWSQDAPVLCVGPPQKVVCLTAEQQVALITQARAAWYIALVMGQFFHLFMCKTRRASIWRHGLTSNTITIFGLCLEFCLVIIFVYVPGVQDIMGASAVSFEPWVIALAVGVALWVYGETNKKKCRDNKHTKWQRRLLAW